MGQNTLREHYGKKEILQYLLSVLNYLALSIDIILMEKINLQLVPLENSPLRTVLMRFFGYGKRNLIIFMILNLIFGILGLMKMDLLEQHMVSRLEVNLEKLFMKQNMMVIKLVIPYFLTKRISLFMN